jgi:hypothetical protein
VKKYIFLVLMVFSLGVFAASVDLGVKGSLNVNPQANKPNNFAVGQTDVTLAAANKNIAFNWVFNLDSTLGASKAPTSKYAFVSGKIFGGTGEVGVINPIIASDFGGGFYGDSAFFGQFCMDGAGLSFATGPWTVAYTGAATLLNDGSSTLTGQLGVAYDVCDTGKVAVIMNQNKAAGTTGYDLYIQKAMSFGALDLSTQIIWGLQSSAQKQLVAIYANYSLDKTQSVYFTYTDDLSEVSTITTKAYDAGYQFMVNESVTAIANFNSNLATDVQNLTVGLNFAL